METTIESKSLLIGSIFWAILFFIIGMYSGTLMVKQTTITVPTKYSNSEIDKVIGYNVFLIQTIHEQVEYEKSFEKNCH